MKDLRLHLLLSVVLVNLSASFASGPGLQYPEQPPGTVPLFQPEYPGLSHFFKDSTIYESPFTHLRRVEKLDSSQTKLEIRELLFDKDYELPQRMDLDYYVKERLKHQNQEMWRKTAIKDLQRQETTGPGGIELNIPVKIKSKAFKRIFGGDRVGLRVTGNISFELAGRAEKRGGAAVSSIEQRGNFSPRFKQTQQFQVEGRVGDKVSVKVDQNSEATFDFENTLRLTYTGDEDEIIQKIEAGNVSLNLPGTDYVSASSKHQGLFGLKTEMKLGNLSFVGIASLQRGEKQKLTKTGGADENTFRIKDIEYVHDRFFFVDSIYAANFESGYDPESMTWTVFNNGGYRITQLDVYRKVNYKENNTHYGWAVLDPQSANLDTLELSGEDRPGYAESAYFQRLDPSEYGYDEYRGFFWLNQNVNEQDIVAVAYETENGYKQGMLFQELTDSAATVLLKLVKPKASKPTYPTWNLSMRNVYNLGASQISKSGFDIKILFTKEGDDVDVQPVGEHKPFIYLMGLDRLNEQGSFLDGGDKQIDINNGNIFDLSNGYLIFPSLTPFSPPEGSNFQIDPSLHVDIYDIKDHSAELQQHKFDVEVTTSSVSSTFNLGFNVLEGSEVVKLNGRELEKDKDYTIDYFGGTLQILDPEARRADANVEIEYERGSLFQLDKKTLLGGRMEYSLGDRGFVGMTGLYLNKTTLDQRVRLGQEPVKNFIWDINTALDFHPNFITKAFDLLPVVETSAESKLHVEAEFAQVRPNPNTFNEESLGEKTGVAYIDDFEGSERTTPLGVIYRGWSPASIPRRFRIPKRGIDRVIPSNDEQAIYAMDRSRVRMFWYNPFNQVPIKDIWPNKDVNTQTGTTTNVLTLRWKNDTIPDSIAWAGIMRSTINFPDQNKTKFIELWIQPDSFKTGRVNIDIGRINEDFYVRQNTTTFEGKRSWRNLNTEDFNFNGLLDEGEDVGLDGVPDGNPNDDPFDNWSKPLDTNPNFLQINGTEGNGQAQGARYPDTEDMDGDGGLNNNDEYFTYSFNLADSSSYIKGGTESGWVLYRIPIRNYDPNLKIGNPDENFREIFFVRLWINDLPEDGQYHAIRIATFDFVGNEWEESGVATNQDSAFVQDDSLFSIAVYNTEENTKRIEGGPEPYHSPPNVTGIRDRITKALSKEQSLVLQLGRLEPGAFAEANKQLYEKMNLIHYKKLKMFVHGDEGLPQTNSPLQFYMKFGPTESIYYEFGGPVYPHWDSRNNIDLIMDELAKTHNDEFLTGDSIGGQPVYFRQDPENPEKYFRVVGKPSLRNINFMIIGARNTSDFAIVKKEIWIDELRVTDVERDKGSAMRLTTVLNLADIASLRAQWEVQDADFRRIEDQFGSGNTTEKQQYRMNLHLNKFFPTSWGLKIPVSGGFVRSRNVPKYFYNSDQLTKYKPQGFGEKVKQFFGMTDLSPELEKNSQISENKSLGATISRSGNPKTPWYLKYSVDMLTVDVDWNQKHSSTERDLLNDAETINGQFQLNVPWGKENTFKPFGWLGNGPIVRTLANQKMYYTPNSMNFKLGIRDNKNTRQARLEDQATTTTTTSSSRSVSLGYNLFPSLSTSFSRDYNSDAGIKGYRAQELVQAIITDFDFGLDKVINQNFSANYNPTFFSWMTQSFKYSSSFNYNFKNVDRNEKASGLQVSKQLSVGLKPSQLVNAIYNPAKRKIQQRRTPQRHAEPPRSEGGEGNRNIPGREEGGSGGEEEPEGGKETPGENTEPGKSSEQPGKQEQSGGQQQGSDKSGGGLSVPNPALLVWKFFDFWKSVNLDYRLTDNYNYFNIDRMPTWKHQFGFSSDPGVGTDTTAKKIPVLPSIRHAKDITGNVNLDIIQNLSVSLKYNYSKNVNQNNQQTTEDIANTYFYYGNDPDANQKSFFQYVPDWQLRLTGVEKFFFFDKYARSIQVEHARSGKYTEKNRYDNNIKSKDSWGYTNNYSPFLGISINTIWGVNGNIRFTNSTTYTYNSTGAANKSLRSAIDVTFSFSKSGGFRIPLPFLNKKKLKNEMQFSLNFNSSNDVTFGKRPGDADFEEQSKNSSYKIKPSVTYRFSQKVNGSMFFERSVSHNKLTGEYSYMEFGINVNIAIR